MGPPPLPGQAPLAGQPSGQPPSTGDTAAAARKGRDNLPAFKAQTDGPANLVVVADSDILADRFWVRVSDFFGQTTATPISDNGPFVANLIGTLAGSDALIGLRSRGDTNRPFTLVAAMQSQAEAQFRQTQQALQQHLEDVEKQLQTLRSGEGRSGEGRSGLGGSGEGGSLGAGDIGQGERAQSDAVITPDQRAAIDTARQDILQTRQKLRAVQLALNRDISELETEMRVFTIVLVPALLTVLAITMGILQRRRQARARR